MPCRDMPGIVLGELDFLYNRITHDNNVSEWLPRRMGGLFRWMGTQMSIRNASLRGGLRFCQFRIIL